MLAGVLNCEEIFSYQKNFDTQMKVNKIAELGNLLNNNSDLITQVNVLI